MKILHLISFYLPAYSTGGPIASVHNLNKYLVQRGARVVVYTTNLGGEKTMDVPLNTAVNLDGVEVWYFPVNSFWKKWEYSPMLRRKLYDTLKDFDVVHIDSIFRATSFWGGYYSQKMNRPYVISPRGGLMREPLQKGFFKNLKKRFYISLIEKKNLANAAAIHFTCEKERDEYLASSLPLKKAIIIPNGFSPEEFNAGTSDVPNIDVNARTSDVQKLDFRQRFGISTDKKIILFLARLHPIKGLDTLIPSFAEVLKKEPNAILVLAGPDEKNYKKEIELEIRNWKLEINKDIVFAGMLVGEDKISALQESDVFVLPSYSECLPMAVVEAMSFSLPVVITKNVGISPSVEKAGAGIVIDKDEKQLAEAILKILNNSKLAKEMGERGRKLVEAEFSAEKAAERWIEEYSKLL
jgi:glycosyltransferase involved in cell wall biosynthesis